jgi:hypothetical protein
VLAIENVSFFMEIVANQPTAIIFFQKLNAYIPTLAHRLQTTLRTFFRIWQYQHCSLTAHTPTYYSLKSTMDAFDANEK